MEALKFYDGVVEITAFYMYCLFIFVGFVPRDSKTVLLCKLNAL